MTTITEAQRVALVRATEALWDKAENANTEAEADYYEEAYYVVKDLIARAGDAK